MSRPKRLSFALGLPEDEGVEVESSQSDANVSDINEGIRKRQATVAVEPSSPN